MIGGLRHRVTIESLTRTADGQGGFAESWSTLASVWSKITPVSARELVFAGRTEHEVTHRIKMRYRSDVKSEMRITYGSRTFQIKGVRSPDERGKFLELDCIEGTGAAE